MKIFLKKSLHKTFFSDNMITLRKKAVKQFFSHKAISNVGPASSNCYLDNRFAGLLAIIFIKHYIIK
ncbi:hypothetical protein FC65_GL001131 [Ligilactobacillus acidipiscis DSM 15836]|uniref:Uncharacterized protein n=1 Tax=Ligilactobacillus acidipiscis DSM 15836 TaxID=1423716 RepID=A0ABR5PM40_9LACO|nr:hypothetical protein FC65_GL001131 [Ligilactobacillus acidipiscis DSM 15836]